MCVCVCVCVCVSRDDIPPGCTATFLLFPLRCVYASLRVRGVTLQVAVLGRAAESVGFRASQSVTLMPVRRYVAADRERF